MRPEKVENMRANLGPFRGVPFRSTAGLPTATSAGGFVDMGAAIVRKSHKT